MSLNFPSWEGVYGLGARELKYCWIIFVHDARNIGSEQARPELRLKKNSEK
jgi:hypothetical protein